MKTIFEATDSMHHPNRSLWQLFRGWDFVKIWAASVLLLRLFALGKPLPELIIIYARSYFSGSSILWVQLHPEIFRKTDFAPTLRKLDFVPSVFVKKCLSSSVFGGHKKICTNSSDILTRALLYKRMKKRARSPNVRECTKISRIFLQLPYPHL